MDKISYTTILNKYYHYKNPVLNYLLHYIQNNFDKHYFNYKQIGGKEKQINIYGKDFIYNVDKIDVDDDRHNLDFHTLKSKDKIEDICGTIVFDIKDKHAIIQLAESKPNCNSCVDKNFNFKHGDIMMHIMINTIIKKGYSKIYIEDMSRLPYYSNPSIFLIYFRTMTHGLPLYTKYGFYPESKQAYHVLQHNQYIYSTKPSIDKNILLDMINKHEFTDEEKSFQNKYIILKLNDNTIFIKAFFLFVGGLYLTIKSKYFKYLTQFIDSIYIDVFHYAKYKEYRDKSFVLNI